MTAAMQGHPEDQYIRLLGKIVAHGERRETRNSVTFSLFGERLEFDVAAHGFPLLTTKRVFWRGIVEELLWFLRGDTDAKKLSDRGVHIWDGNTTRAFLDSRGLAHYREGECGPIYGWQWRRFGAAYPSGQGGVDQLRDLLEQLVCDPMSRRMIVSGWNPKQHAEMCLPACHTLYQFYLDARGLSCQLYARSQDVACGTPYNIASTALWTSILAHILGVPVSRIILVSGDTHLYEPHLDGVREQVQRAPRPFPQLRILRPRPFASLGPDTPILALIEWIESLKFEDFEMVGYDPHPAIKYQMVA